MLTVALFHTALLAALAAAPPVLPAPLTGVVDSLDEVTVEFIRGLADKP